MSRLEWLSGYGINLVRQKRFEIATPPASRSRKVLRILDAHICTLEGPREISFNRFWDRRE
jgi:hypothetical protein